MPAAGGQPLERCFRRLFVGQVERLRVIFLRKGDDLLALDDIRAEAGPVADRDILEIFNGLSYECVGPGSALADAVETAAGGRS